jgi:hypothetical protein
VTREAGLNFVYDNDASPARRLIETTGGGCAFLDFDNDGLLDIFVVQGGPAPGSASRPRPTSALFRNTGSGKFVDFTRAARLDVDTGYGQGVAAADYDNDGWQDLLVTSYGELHLFHNKQGRFHEVTGAAGLMQKRQTQWFTSAAWGDYDADGLLDLAVCVYADWTPENNRNCTDNDDRPIYCVPTMYSEVTSLLYHNEGSGRFRDVSRSSGLASERGRALGALWTDFDGDGRQDLFLANDMSPNLLMHNRGKGKFVNVGYRACVALGPEGRPLSGMGVAAADFRSVSKEDLFVVNFSQQPRSYFRNDGGGCFSWGSHNAGLGNSEQPFLAFGVESLDYDRDGLPDLVVGNGHINDVLGDGIDGVSFRERQQLLRNLGDGRFEEDRRLAGDLEIPRVTRGLAVGDYDGDGRSDVMVVGPKSPLQLFRNQTCPSRHWVGFRTEGVKSNRDGIGSVVRVSFNGSTRQKVVRSGSSYCSRSDLRLVFGLGDSVSSVDVEVLWPSGVRTKSSALQPDRYYLVRENGQVSREPRVATHGQTQSEPRVWEKEKR